MDGGFERWIGGHVHAPDQPGAELAQTEVLRRVAIGFRRVIIDWPEGQRWAEARAARAEEFGYRGFLLEAERALRDESVMVSITDAVGPDPPWLRFYMTADAGILELFYDPAAAAPACDALAIKLAGLLGYEFAAREEDNDEPGHATNRS